MIKHVPGKLHTAADMLSRPPTEDKGEQDNNDLTLLPKEMFICQTNPELDQEPLDLGREVANAQKTHRQTMKQSEDAHHLDFHPTHDHQPQWFKDHWIVVPPEIELRRKIMRRYHDNPTAGHPGRDETTQATKREYWWPNMNQWIENYVKGCAPCQQNKNLTHHARTPMYCIAPGPGANPFEEIAMDLITQLPKNGTYDAILTIVDHGCTRAAIFIPCSTSITGEGIANLYLNNVYQWFGLPRKMISDRDLRFTSHFAKALTRRLGVKQNISMAYHPQTDGLSERKNQWVEQYLRFVTSTQQDDWSKWLVIASLVHNSRINATIKMAPLQALLEYLPRLMAEASALSTNQRVEERAEEMTKRREQARTALAQCTQGMPLDQFTPGDQVWLKAKHLKLPYQAPKLAPKRHGPFVIIKRVSPVAYQLQLPIAWTIHDIFHASLLTPYRKNEAHGPNYMRPPPDLIAGEAEYEVESVVNHCFHGRTRTLQYLIHWKGYPSTDDSWEPAGQVHAPALVAKYHQKNPLQDPQTYKNPKKRQKISIRSILLATLACPLPLPPSSKSTKKTAPPTKSSWNSRPTLPSSPPTIPPTFKPLIKQSSKTSPRPLQPTASSENSPISWTTKTRSVYPHAPASSVISSHF